MSLVSRFPAQGNFEMPKISKILVPVDFSPRNLAAVKNAAEIAHRFDSEVTLLHVNALADGNRLANLRELDQFAVAELRDVKAMRCIANGDPAEEIVKFAHANHIDLIVMPTYGFKPRQLLLGSVTAKVLHDAQCPVWTTSHLPPIGTDPNPGAVVCAVDFGTQSSSVVRWAAEYASAIHGELIVMHAVRSVPAELPERYSFHWKAEAHSGAEEKLRALLLRTHIEGETIVAEGTLPEAVANTALDKGAALLVIGRHSSPCKGGRLGSHAYGILCSCPCPVVSI